MSDLRLATGRYHNPNVKTCGLIPVGITRGAPRFPLDYDIRANLYDLAPTHAMMKLADEPNGRAKFAAAYRTRLDALGLARICELLMAVQNGDDGLVLLCYEDLTDGTQWCHRRLFADWMIVRGVPVTELEDPGKKRKVSQETLFS